MKKLFSFTLLFILLNIKTLSVHAQTPTSRLAAENSIAGDNESKKSFQFAAIILKIHRNENVYNAHIVQSRVINTAYKKVLNPIPSNQEGDLVCYMMNQNNMTIDSLTIGNPLSEHFEIFAEDGTISHRTIDKTENEVMIRFNYTAAMQFMLIKKIEKDGRLTTIAKLNILTAN